MTARNIHCKYNIKYETRVCVISCILYDFEFNMYKNQGIRYSCMKTACILATGIRKPVFMPKT